MRVGVATLHHETNSFSNLLINMERLEKVHFTKERYYQIYAPLHGYSGGIFRKCEELGIQAVPTGSVYLAPAGIIERDAMESFRDDTVRLLWEAHQEAPLDAIALNLHGAGVADGYPDADGEMLRAIREKFGYDIPIGCVLDLHGNVTREMMEYADLLVGVKGYPHSDQFEMGAKMMQILADMTEHHWKPCKSHIQLPWLIAPAEGVTLSGPAYDVQQFLMKKEAREADLLNASFFHGFAYADIDQAGVSVTTMAKTQEAADRAALEIARYAWGHRKDFAVPANSAEQAIDIALKIPRANGPVVINESSDNPGGGAPGDGTHLLRELLKRNLPNTVFCGIYDPEVAEMAAKAGIRARISCKLGGKMDNLHGEPIELTDAYVKCISDGVFMNESKVGGGGLRYTGTTVLLVVGNVKIVVSSSRGQSMDDGYMRTVGIRYDMVDLVCLKSSQHFKDWWKDHCTAIVACDSPGIHSSDLSLFDFKYTNKNYYPLADAKWDGE